MGKHAANDVERWTVSTAWLATICGLSERRVRQLAAEGVFVRAGRGQYWASRSIRGYAAHLEQRAAEKSAPSAATRLMDTKSRRIELAIERQERDLMFLADALEDSRDIADAILESVDEIGRRVAAELGKDDFDRQRILAIVAQDRARLASRMDHAIEKFRTGRVDS